VARVLPSGLKATCTGIPAVAASPPANVRNSRPVATIPQLHGLIATATRQHLAVGTESYRGNIKCMAGQRLLCAATGDVPEFLWSCRRYRWLTACRQVLKAIEFTVPLCPLSALS
jgi:hypothetical protein